MGLTQERIVLLIFAVLFVLCSMFLPNFLSTANILNLIRAVSVLGILGIAMAVVVIGRGVDLSIIATMAMSVAFSLQLAQQGMPLWQALIAGFAFAILMGAITGYLVAYVEVPSLFATLAMGTFIYGFGRFSMVSLDVIYAPTDVAWFEFIGKGRVVGIPMPVLLFAGIALLVSAGMKFLRIGQVTYLIGDNLEAARITGLSVRPTLVLHYVLASAIAFGAGVIVAASVNSMNTRIVNSSQIYDVILVVVLGGIGLSGGKGGVRNVIIGTLLIGTLLNAMTILDFPYTLQNLIKGMILLMAIGIDGFINPRDEQTAQQGDI